MAKEGSDKRVYKRIEASLEVDYSTYSPYHIRRITNISQGGLFIRTQDILPVGSVLDISFRLADTVKPIQTQVKVIWTYRQPASVTMNSSGMGVQFLEIDDDDLKSILKFIDSAPKN